MIILLLKKVAVASIGAVTLFGGFGFSSASASSEVVENTKNNSINTQIEIQPFATIIEMDKPIAEQGYISNYKLGQILNRYETGTNWLNIVNTIIYAGGVTAPAGVANSLASSLAGSPTALRSAYYSGKHAYYVSVYASGVKPSLSKIAYIYYTNDRIVFRD